MKEISKELKKEIKNMKMFERKEINNVLFEKNSFGSYNVYCGDRNDVYEIADSINWVYDYKFKYLINLLEREA